MANKILIGRATKARLETIKETLLSYELVYSMDTNELGVKNSDGTITYFGVVTELEWANILNKPTFATVATSGKYADLTGKPDLNLKLDKDFSALPTQANPLLTDVLVLNRGTTAQKVTLGNLLAKVDNEIFEVVANLPATGVVNKIYLVPSDDPESIDNYVEWLWYDSKWERLGGFTLDLSNYYNKTQIDGMVGSYVLKETGKGLSTNDYTTTEKNKLAGIAAGAEVNVQADWNITDTGSDAFIKNKPTIPTVPAKATKTEAETGTNDTKYMTPLRTKDAIAVAMIDGGDL
jgi:hypothetical protein